VLSKTGAGSVETPQGYGSPHWVCKGKTMGKHEENTRRIRGEYEENTRRIRGGYEDKALPTHCHLRIRAVVPNRTIGHSGQDSLCAFKITNCDLKSRAWPSPEVSAFRLYGEWRAHGRHAAEQSPGGKDESLRRFRSLPCQRKTHPVMTSYAPSITAHHSGLVVRSPRPAAFISSADRTCSLARRAQRCS
jgi:hypothetical protein